MLDGVPSSLLPLGEAGCSVSFWLCDYMVLHLEEELQKSIPQIFLPPSVWLVSCLPRVQKPSNWSLGFSQKELAPVLLSYSVYEKKERAFYFIILLMLPNFSFLKYFRMFYLFILQLTCSLIALHSENKLCMILVISNVFAFAYGQPA